MNLVAYRQSLHLSGFDPDQLATLLSEGQLEHLLLGPARCEVMHQRWCCGPLILDVGRYSFPVRAFGTFPEKKVCVGFMRHQTVPTWVNGFQVDLGTIEFYPAGSELNYRAGEHGEWVAIMLEEQHLQAAALRRLGRELDLPRGGALSYPVPKGPRTELERCVRRLMAADKVRLAAIESFTGLVAEMLGTLQGKRIESLVRRSHWRREILNQVDRCLRSRIGQPFDARWLAERVGATERTIQRQFSEAFGISPRQWARCLALHQARKRLKAADERVLTVEGIASETGFAHMGRFAGYYRDLFGELPSDTLARGAVGSPGIG